MESRWKKSIYGTCTVAIGEVMKCKIGDFSLTMDAFERIQNIEENSNLYTVVKSNCKIT